MDYEQEKLDCIQEIRDANKQESAEINLARLEVLLDASPMDPTRHARLYYCGVLPELRIRHVARVRAEGRAAQKKLLDEAKAAYIEIYKHISICNDWLPSDILEIVEDPNLPQRRRELRLRIREAKAIFKQEKNKKNRRNLLKHRLLKEVVGRELIRRGVIVAKKSADDSKQDN